MDTARDMSIQPWMNTQFDGFDFESLGRIVGELGELPIVVEDFWAEFASQVNNCVAFIKKDCKRDKGNMYFSRPIYNVKNWKAAFMFSQRKLG